MSTDKLMLDLIHYLIKLSDVEVLLEFGIEGLQFIKDALVNIERIHLARIYIQIGDSYIGMN